MGPPKFEQRVGSAAPEPSIPTNVFPDEEYFNRAGAWDDKDLKSLLNANKEWAKHMAEKTPGFFAELSRGHAPKILWIGCSDARVPANEIIGEPPGSVFVHRNVANMVISTDVNCMSVLQYAVDVLKVKHIVVCGHYECGGVRAALEPIDHGSPLEGWLRNIKDTYRLHKDELCGIEDLKDRQRRLVELNVEEQVCIPTTYTGTSFIILVLVSFFISVFEYLQIGGGAEESHRDARTSWQTRVSLHSVVFFMS